MVFEALGHQDELCAVIGIAREHCDASGNGLADTLAEIQSRVFDLGAAVATPVQTSDETKRSYTEFHPRFTKELERAIDKFDEELPPLTNFVIPSGGLSSTYLNLARTVCRRAERAVVPLVMAEQCDKEVGIFLNRLSDFLFAAGRAAAKREGKTEILWIRAKDV
jgi:cob(I)alamin adenosyltransferase